MSTNLSLLFNPIAGENIAEVHKVWIDIEHVEGYEDDEDICFSNYVHELGLYKLAKSHNQRGEKEFASTAGKLRSKIDFSIPPMLLMNCDIIVGYLNKNFKCSCEGMPRIYEFEPIYHRAIEGVLGMLARIAENAQQGDSEGTPLRGAPDL